MSPKEFFDLVVKMREAQKEYFRTKAYGTLSQAQKLERQVDMEVKRVQIIEREQAMPRLFNKLEDD